MNLSREFESQYKCILIRFLQSGIHSLRGNYKVHHINMFFQRFSKLVILFTEGLCDESVKIENVHLQLHYAPWHIYVSSDTPSCLQIKKWSI